MSTSDRVNILVVDDMPDKLLAMQAILEELDQNIVAVRSGREALRRLLEQEFAVILLDVNMPDMDGFETATLIRQRERLEHTPIIFVTAFSDETHAGQGYSLGAVDYILAPVIPEVLRTKVGVFVDLYRKSQQIKQQAEERVTLAKEQAARAAAEALTRRTTFLADASSQLTRSLDFDATVTALLSLALDELGGITGFSATGDRGMSGHCQLCWRMPDAPKIERLRLSSEQLPAPLYHAMSIVSQSGRAQSLHAIALNNLPLSDDQNVAPIECSSVVVLPLIARGKAVGVLWIGQSPAQDPIDLSLAEDLASRAAIALDNARLYQTIQEGDRRKDEFLAMLGHELRNPLAAISNALECQRLAQDDEVLVQDAQAILERQVQQMSRLVDDLLDVSRITQGKVELRQEIVDLAAIVRRAVTATAAMVSARSHQLSIAMPPGPLLLFADPTRMEQILANLINNAAKYTEPEGKISVVVERSKYSLVVRVIDNGIGIPEKLLPQIFELFTQGDRSLDRSQGGLGIGLTLVQRLVEMHGGEVHAESRGPNKGTEFVVRLPEHKPEPSAKNTESNGSETGEITAAIRRVLLVDDNQDLTFTMSMLLKKAGHEVRIASDGPASLELAASWHPEIMLIDIGLPGLNGYEVAKKVRDHVALQDSILIAMTGYGQAEDRQRSHEAGFDHHLVKPVSFADLQRVLAQCQDREAVASQL